MGNVLGLGIGARLASPESHVVGITGDGCFRLFAGCLSEASGLDLLLFVLDNASYGLVEQALPTILPGMEPSRGHTRLTAMDFGDVARACGWAACQLNPDLSNLEAPSSGPAPIDRSGIRTGERNYFRTSVFWLLGESLPPSRTN